MKKVKILHCGDMHFDTPFKELPKKLSNTSKEELLEVFKRIIDLSIKEKIQVLLIAGDVFDNLTVSKTTLYFIASQLQRIPEVHVFIAPGNHDPYGSKSFYSLVNWPNNVHIFKGSMEGVEIEALDLVVWGAGFNNSYERQSIFEKQSIDKNKINLMVLHGELCNKGSVNEYNPIYLEVVKNSGMDYIALGHRHGYSDILKEGNTYYAYSGCPQGRGFDEEGPKGVILGDVYNGGVELQFRTICKREYIVKEINISSCYTYDEVKAILTTLFNKNDRLKNYYKIILKGQLKEHFNLNEDVLLQKLHDDFYFIKIVNKTTIEINIEELAKDFSIRGRFIERMLKRLEEVDEEEKDVINMALKLGMQCLSEEEVNLNDN